MEKKKDNYKILILGDHAVGKSCFIIRYTDDTFQDVYLSTIGMDCKYKDINFENGKSIRLQIWDTAGQDRFHSLTKNLYKGAAGIILLYDISNRKSFDNVKKWIESIKEEASSKVLIVLVGNKIDKTEERQVKKVEGEDLAEELKLPFFECSALTGENINNAFLGLAKKLVEIRENVENKGEKLTQVPVKNNNNDKNNKKMSCC